MRTCQVISKKLEGLAQGADEKVLIAILVVVQVSETTAFADVREVANGSGFLKAWGGIVGEEEVARFANPLGLEPSVVFYEVLIPVVVEVDRSGSIAPAPVIDSCSV